MTSDHAPDPIDVHTFFGLSYATHLVWPRSVMQSMPDDWQHRFTALARGLVDACEHHKIELPVYNVKAMEEPPSPSEIHDWEERYGEAWEPTYIDDPLGTYDRGRRNVFRNPDE